MTISAYPLHWPISRARWRGTRRTAQFKDYGRTLGLPAARVRLRDQLDALGGRQVVLSTNLELRLDGRPRADRTAPSDPGVALYFKLAGRDTVLACDKWDRVADNIGAIAKHIEALRGQDRWGVGTIEQAFAGYQALPAPEGAKDWREVLGLTGAVTLAQIDAAYRAKAHAAHPDKGGSTEAMARLNAARAAAKAALG